MLIPIGFFGAGGLSGPFELITTINGDNTSKVITFSSIPQTYKHLQIRFVASTNLNESTATTMRFNGISSTTYASHRVYSDSNSAIASGQTNGTQIFLGGIQAGIQPQPTVAIVDILDYASTVKNKTAMAMFGLIGEAGAREITLSGGFLNSTAAISSISIQNIGIYGFNTASRFSLYGIKG